jgi:phosphoribosyl 1,2-cyclic phosphodiesterase
MADTRAAESGTKPSAESGNSITVKFYGVRGSIPICSPEFQEFGGNTTCIRLDGPLRTIIFDAGTGIRVLGKELARDQSIGMERPCILAFSHFHWDHIQGLPFFVPAYDKRRTFTLSALGRERFGKDLRTIFETTMQQEYFPVSLEGMGAQIDFLQSSSDTITAGEAEVDVLRHNHPGGAYSYRFTTSPGKVVVICTDIEHGDALDERIIELASGADLLIHEGQYTPEELKTYRGWGHSSWEQAVEVAERAGVKQLVITHHDPDHDDLMLHEIEARCKKRFPSSCLAREKMEIII